MRLTVTGVAMAMTVTLSTAAVSAGSPTVSDVRGVVPLAAVVPQPVGVRTARGVAFDLESTDAIYATGSSADAKDAANFLAGLLRIPTGYPLEVRELPAGAKPAGIVLSLGGNNAVTKKEGYRLDIDDDAVTIEADDRAGLFNGVATLRQLLPVKVERKQQMPGPWRVQGGTIDDAPRYAYRGAMLDVGRHFLPKVDVEKYIDTIARYKVNYLRLHLTDDQGWRIEIKSWPELTEVGGQSGAGDQGGGFYTQEDYKGIVQYAQARGVTVIPEIDGPDHTHAALASYAKLTCDGEAIEPYVGYPKSDEGVLCLDNPTTYEFLDDVIGEVAALSPGPYFAVGGDETSGRTKEQLDTYFSKVAKLLEKHGKKPLGWMEAAGSLPAESSMTEFWVPGINEDQIIASAKAGGKVIMAPAMTAYLDQKYTDSYPEYPLGQTWAGPTSVQRSYEWDPENQLEGLPASAVGGVDAPLFTETVFGIHQLESLAFPRLLSIAEIGWAKASSHDWKSFEPRLAAQGPRLREARVDYYPSPEIDWPMGS
ncbi:beta-N-acetylhexosaminidase [Streptomyces sp. NBC_00316]|uniref:beta-N-acetylhexosaminidase n=1 Tax=Streptomyces sp. NBC_00316 TaxID=2975710 RepID=UPI002E2AE248|nr:beta-N-acetylhexosaminidase [Streptomyces sp. NBC_00316]